MRVASNGATERLLQTWIQQNLLARNFLKKSFYAESFARYDHGFWDCVSVSRARCSGELDSYSDTERTAINRVVWPGGCPVGLEVSAAGRNCVRKPSCNWGRSSDSVVARTLWLPLSPQFFEYCLQRGFFQHSLATSLAGNVDYFQESFCVLPSSRQKRTGGNS